MSSEQMAALGLAHRASFLSMAISSLTKEKLVEAKTELRRLCDEKDEVEATSAPKMWVKELRELREAYLKRWPLK